MFVRICRELVFKYVSRQDDGIFLEVSQSEEGNQSSVRTTKLGIGSRLTSDSDCIVTNYSVIGQMLNSLGKLVFYSPNRQISLTVVMVDVVCGRRFFPELVP